MLKRSDSPVSIPWALLTRSGHAAFGVITGDVWRRQRSNVWKAWALFAAG